MHIHWSYLSTNPPDVKGAALAVQDVNRYNIAYREDTCVYVRVSVRKDDGKWYLLRDDITSLSFAGGPCKAGEERRVAFRFADHAFRLEPGDILRLDVAGASPHFAPHPNVAGDAFACSMPQVARNTIYPDHSFIELPCR